MKELIIRKYRIKNGEKRFELIDSPFNECTDIPKSFILTKNNDLRNKKAEYMMYCVDLKGIHFRSGVRSLRKNILYADRWWKSGRKSFIIIRYLGNNIIELHYFDGFCPENKTDRSAFLTYYFEDSGIANREFKTGPMSWEQKRYRRFKEYKQNRRRGLW
jgi:hypothetical protein